MPNGRCELEGTCRYCAPPSFDVGEALLAVEDPAEPRGDAAIGDRGCDSEMFFTVVLPRPGAMKVARQGRFAADDMGIAVHECYEWGPESTIVGIGAACLEGPFQGATENSTNDCLVLALSGLELTQLSEF